MKKEEAYRQKLRAKLDRLAAEIARLRAMADEAEADAKLRLYDELDGLSAQQQELRRRVEQLRQAGDSAWEDLRSGVELAWRDLEQALRQATKRFE